MTVEVEVLDIRPLTDTTIGTMITESTSHILSFYEVHVICDGDNNNHCAVLWLI